MVNNRFDKILLVNFYYALSGYGPKLNYPPLGIGYISEYLESFGFETGIMDIHIDDDLNEPKQNLFKQVNQFKPDIIGFSINSINIGKSLDMIMCIKKQFNDLKIIVGGPHASSKQREILETNAFIDYVAIHEGENILKELMSGVDETKIDGLCFRKDNAIILNPSKAIEDLNLLKWPKYMKFDMENYLEPDAIAILTSRGCPYL
jgi:radical SAM superfamily enzyme YgiQ (UPF0313 family)